MANTTADKLALAAANKAAIKAAIEAKNPTTAPTNVMSQWPTAIASIPSGGGGEEWQPPSDWPNIRDILNKDTDTTYSNKAIFLVDTTLGNDFNNYGTHYYIFDGYRAERVRFSDGRVESVTYGSPKNVDFDKTKGKYQWVIIETNSEWLSPLGGSGYGGDYGQLGLLWIYGPNAKMNIRFNYVGFKSLRSFEVDIAGGDEQAIRSDSINLSNALSYLKVNEFIHYPKTTKPTFAKGVFLTSPFSIDTSQLTDCNNLFSGFNALKNAPQTLDLSNCTTCNSLFSECNMLESVPAILDLSRCTSCERIFGQCGMLKHVPSVLDISNCTNCREMFIWDECLEELPAVLDFSRCTNCQQALYGLYKVKEFPDVIDMRNCTNNSYVFLRAYSLERLPTHIYSHLSFSFSGSTKVSDASSVAEFDSSGNVVGGMVGNINTCNNNGQSVTLNDHIKSLFSADQWTAIKAALAAKNWGCSPA